MSPVTRLPRLLDAVVAISSDLSLPHVLRRIIESAVDLVDARYGALGVIGPGQTDLERGLVEFITVGADQATIAAMAHYPEGRGILGLLITDPKPRRIQDLTKHEASYGFPENHPVMHSFLGVPIRVRDEVFGVLYLTEKREAPEFSVGDEELVAGLASAAGVAIENARLHTRVEELAVLTDRERIARDLHDTVIQRIFATGMGLQAVLGRIEAPDVAARVQQAVDELDDTIRDLRGAIFALEAHAAGQGGLRSGVYAVAREVESSLGHVPRIHLDGALDAAVPPATTAELLKTLREALSNTARHAGATAADVEVRLREGELVLRITDNGVGMSAVAQKGHGLDNMRARAEALGGHFAVTNGPEGGLAVTWRVPI
jgi:signal transduction histidine kinase